MTYEDFKQAVLLQVKQQFDEHCVVEIRPIEKNNGIRMDGLVIVEQNHNISPTFYLRQYYKEWMDTEEAAALAAAEILQQYREQKGPGHFNTSLFLEFGSACRKLYVRVLNKQWNQSLLEQIPHREVLNLAETVYFRVDMQGITRGTIPVNREHMENWGIDEDQLFSVARANTCQDLPVEFLHMEDMLRRLCGNTLEELGLAEGTPEIPMYVITNKEQFFGAAALFYPNVTKHIADYLDCSYYILPSSVHEMIIVPESAGVNRRELKTIVCEINRTQVEPVEVLSDDIYYYNRDNMTLQVC